MSYIKFMKMILERLQIRFERDPDKKSCNSQYICDIALDVFDSIREHNKEDDERGYLEESFPLFEPWIIKIGLTMDGSFQIHGPWRCDTKARISYLKEYIEQLEKEGVE